MCPSLLSRAFSLSWSGEDRGVNEPTRTVATDTSTQHFPLISVKEKVDMYPVLLREERLTMVDAFTVM